MNRPVVTDKDPLSKKVKWYLIAFFSTLGILILLGGVLPFLVIKYCSRIVGGILFSALFLGGKKTLFYA